ncbi:MAG: hypothetical protein O7D91_07480 [Planctomycetota bacterium]|nr:hypothetical protein [Planctomycetota bacterium]
MNRTNQISANAVPYVIVVFLLVTLLASRSYAETCVGTSLRICVDFISAGNPVFPNDFNVVGDNLILKIGAEDWRVWSQVSASDTTPADFGSITLNPTVPADNFEVEIKNGTTGGAGAANVGSIVLDDAGFTGYSNLGATTIDGHVTGAITLVDDGAMPPQGGEVTGAVVIGLGVFPLGGVDGPITITKVSAFVTIFGSVDGSITITQVSAPVSIFGSVVGPITIPKINASVSIYGDYGDDNASHNIDLGVIANNAGFSIGGDILSDETNTLAIDIEALGDIATGTAGSFAVGGSLTNPLATVTITDMKVIAGAGSIVRFGGDFGGILDLKKGVPGAIADNIVKFIG